MDPIDRARAAAERIETIRAKRNTEMAEAAAERRAAMQDARQTMSVATIAQELGITRERAYAILSGKDPCST